MADADILIPLIAFVSFGLYYGEVLFSARTYAST